MKTVGEMLKNARLKKGMKRRQIVKKTKINLKYLKALEKNDYDSLPESAFVKGFIKNYAQTVGLDPAQVLAVFRRDYDQNVKGKVIPRELSTNDIEKKLIWNPRTSIITVILLVFLVLGSYFIFQYRLLTAAPRLEIISPQEDELVTATVTVHGITDPQATVTINNQQVLVDSEGSFSEALVLTQGTRIITIQAANRSGKIRTLQRTVIVQ